MKIMTSDEIAGVVCRSDGRVCLAAQAQRIGVLSFYAAIEWYWYAPNTTRSRFFEVYCTIWHDMPWAVAAFPVGRLPAVRQLAKRLGLRVSDFPPVLIKNNDNFYIQGSMRPSRRAEFEAQGFPMEFFPGAVLANGQANPRLMTVESDSHSPIYKNIKVDEQTMQQADREISDVLNRGQKLTPAQITDYIYGSDFPPEWVCFRGDERL